jgi:hypothetical protein
LVHVPVDAVSTFPTHAVPEIVGSAVFAGAPEVTGPTEPLVADADPRELVAVTVTVIVSPTSLDISV